MTVVGEPPILYFGTPVVLISTANPDGSANLAPMSSAFWLGWRCIVGLASVSQTPLNLKRTGECVLNLPSDAMAPAVDRLALTTGTSPVPISKAKRGYVCEQDKFGAAGLTAVRSDIVAPPRAAECPVQLEAVLEACHGMADTDIRLRGHTELFELRIVRVHLDEGILLDGSPDRIDPDKWRPLIMSFQRFYGLGPTQPHTSRLASIPEALYRSPDVDRARAQAAP